MPPSDIRVRAVVWAYGRGQTDRQTDRQTDTQTRVTTIHFASSATHAKCNKFNTILYNTITIFVQRLNTEKQGIHRAANSMLI